MADAKPETEDAAEKAYAAAAEAAAAKPVEVPVEAPAAAAPAEPEAEPVEFPAKAKRESKLRPVAKTTAPEVTPAEAPVARPAPRKPAAAKPKRAVRAKPAKAPANAKAVKAKPLKASAARKPAASKPAPRKAGNTVSNTKNISPVSQFKDKIMATTKNTDFTKGIQDAIADVQDKAKVAFEKSASSLGEITEFTKGNVEALVESSKILAAGAQDLGSTYVAESRAAFETLSADVKELATAKTPADFIKLQGDLLRRNFDAAVAAGSKNSEAFLKLANEAFAPISGRFSLAVEKVKKAA